VTSPSPPRCLPVWAGRACRSVMTLLANEPGFAGPVRSWLEQLAGQVRTLGITPAIAGTALSLPLSFPGDPADRLIYATAIEHGWWLVTKDSRLRSHRQPRSMTIW
jgi:predicted nucleic acid-binding protein